MPGSQTFDEMIPHETGKRQGRLRGAARFESQRHVLEAKRQLETGGFKALGVDVWGRSDSLIAMIRAARAAGDQVFADQYPYTASGTSLTAALVPRWAEDGGNAAMLARFADDDAVAQL